MEAIFGLKNQAGGVRLEVFLVFLCSPVGKILVKPKKRRNCVRRNKSILAEKQV